MTIGQWVGQWFGEWFGSGEPAPAGAMSGAATITLSTAGSATGKGALVGSASVTLNSSGELTVDASGMMSGVATLGVGATGALSSTSTPVGTGDYPFFSAGFWSDSFFSAGFWGVASQPYVDLTHAERVYVRTLLYKAYVESSVAQIVVHAEQFDISVLEAIEQLRVKLKLKHDRVLTIFDEVTYISKRAEVRNEKQGDSAYVMLKNESFAVRTLRNEEVALFSKEQRLSAKTVFYEEFVASNRQTPAQVFTHAESMNIHH